MKALFGAAVAAASLGCGEVRGPRGDDAALEVLVPDAPETLDPRASTDAVGVRVTRLVHAGLFRLEPGGLSPVPWMAERVEPAGPLGVRIVLREDARFHSGKPLAPEDVRATVLAFRGSRHAHVVEHVRDVEVDSPRSVVVRLDAPHATLLTDLELPILRADQAGAPLGTEDLDGLGPYRVVARGRDRVELAPARPDAPDGARRPLVVRAVHDENARTLRMLGGRADVLAGGASPALLPAFSRAGLAIRGARGANVTYLLVRADAGPFADVRLRRAAAFAVDRDALARDLFAGRAEPARSMLPPALWAHAPTSAGDAAFRFDPGAARDLVVAARGEGPAPRVAVCTSTDRARRLFGRVVVQALADAGFDAEPCALELGTLLARLGRGDFDAAVLQIPELTEPNVLRVFLHGAMAPPRGANRGRVADATLDALLDAAAAADDRPARAALYARAEARIAEQVWLVPLVHESPTAVTSARAAAFTPTPEGRWSAFAELP